MSEGPVRIGIAGFGVIGQTHAKAVRESELTELIAVADISEQARQAARDIYKIQIYNTVEEMLSDQNIDAVILALTADVRTALAQQALRKGKHILIEKPPAMSARDLRLLLPERRGLVAGCCSGRFRLLPQAQKATEVITSGVLGEVRVLSSRASRSTPARPETLPPPWRLSRSTNSGGILANWGVYDLDFLLGICDWRLRPRSVSAASWGIASQLESWVPQGSDAETHLIGLVRFEGGSVLQIERGEYMSECNSGAWRVVGTKGTLRLQMVPGVQPAVLLDQQGSSGVVSEVIDVADTSYEDFPALLVDDFARAVMNNSSPITGLDDALVIQELLDGMYASSETGAEVVLT